MILGSLSGLRFVVSVRGLTEIRLCKTWHSEIWVNGIMETKVVKGTGLWQAANGKGLLIVEGARTSCAM